MDLLMHAIELTELGFIEYHDKRQKTCHEAHAMTQLPQLIIQRIQSLLTEREAVYSCILSKEWFRAWSTFPVLRFDQSRFMIGRNMASPNIDFVSFVDSTLCRYSAQNLIIEELHLSVSIITCLLISRLNSWFEQATELKLNKYFVKSDPADFSCVLSLKASAMDTLETLSISGCRLDQLPIANCNSLVGLNLIEVDIDDQGLQVFFSNCPCIETFTLLRPTGLTKLHVANLHHLKSLTTEVASDVIVEINSPSIQSIDYRPSDFPNWGLLAINSRLNLTHVCILGANIKDMFTDEFPSLKYLEVTFSNSWFSDVHIRSNSLKRLILKNLTTGSNGIKVDAPNLENFTYTGGKVPKFVGRNIAQPQLKATLELYQGFTIERKWFMELNETLQILHQYEVCLSLGTCTWMQIYMLELKAVSSPSPEHVNDIQCRDSSAPLALLDALFSICRPKYFSIPELYTDTGIQCSDLVTDMLLLKDVTKLRCCYCNDSRCWRRCLKGAEILPTKKMMSVGHYVRFIIQEW